MSAAVLLSGGMDSTAVAYWLRPDYTITVDYGQAAAAGELRAATAITDALGVRHEIIRVDCRTIGAGVMAPEGPGVLPFNVTPEWWPFRNQLVVTLAAARAIRFGVTSLAIGTVRSDARFADGTPGFVSRLDSLLSHQEGGIRLAAPALEMSTVELVRASGVLAEMLGWSLSCHRSENPCGRCNGCRKRAECWSELQL
ncbi:MAG: 7-cyano-7-deazaguanine synthase [Gemmataceae bacterium]